MRRPYQPILLQIVVAIFVAPAVTAEQIDAVPSATTIQQNTNPTGGAEKENGSIEAEFGKILNKINSAEKAGFSVCLFLDSFYAINKVWHRNQDAPAARSRLAALSNELDDLLERVQEGTVDAKLGVKGQNKLELDATGATLRKLQWKINLAWGNGVGVKTYCEMFNPIVTAYLTGNRESLDAQADRLATALDSQLTASKNIRESLGLSVATLVGMEKGGFDYQPFMAYIQRRIKLGWYPPKIESVYRLKTTFIIQKSGEIGNIKIENPLKVTEFNDAALAALSSAGPVLRPEPEPKGTLKLEFTFGYKYQTPKALPPSTSPATTRSSTGR